MDLKIYFNLVDDCIKELGVDPDITRADKQGQWDLYLGSAHVMIDVFEMDNGWGYFQAIAPICMVPEQRAVEFYTEVLETNHKLFGVGFTKFKDWIYIKTIRELAGIDKDEILAMLQRVGSYADEYDDLLKNKYFGDIPKEI